MSEQEKPSFLHALREKLKKWARVKSPWVLHLNSGSCNGCDIEILSALTPRLDAERFGVKLVGSPRHADVLVCTGPVTMKMLEVVVQTYEQLPDPKFVIVVGSCGATGGVFKNSYNVLNGIDSVLPVDIYVPGCPPKPEAIFLGIARLLEKIQKNEPPAHKKTGGVIQRTVEVKTQ